MTIFNITTEQPLAANTESPLLVKTSFGNTRYGTSQRPKQWRCNEMAKFTRSTLRSTTIPSISPALSTGPLESWFISESRPV